MAKKKTEYDTHIVEALKKLPVPLQTAGGAHIYFNRDKRNESIYEHVAKKCHRLTIKDIAIIPYILKQKTALKKGRNGSKFRSYVGRRGKKKEKIKYLKIVTEIIRENVETVVSIYLIKTRDC